MGRMRLKPEVVAAEEKAGARVQTESYYGETSRIRSQSSSTNVEIANKRGESIAEFDLVSLKNGFVAEEKSAEGLYKINPQTGRPQQTPEQWAMKQIYEKTLKKISAIENGEFTRKTVETVGEVPTINQLKPITKYYLLINSQDPALQKAVTTQLVRLSQQYPNWTFNVSFGKQ